MAFSFEKLLDLPDAARRAVSLLVAMAHNRLELFSLECREEFSFSLKLLLVVLAGFFSGHVRHSSGHFCAYLCAPRGTQADRHDLLCVCLFSRSVDLRFLGALVACASSRAVCPDPLKNSARTGSVWEGHEQNSAGGETPLGGSGAQSAKWSQPRMFSPQLGLCRGSRRAW